MLKEIVWRQGGMIPHNNDIIPLIEKGVTGI